MTEDQAEPARANEHGEAVRKRPKLGAFAREAHIGNEVTLKPSAFAVNKLRDRKYVEFYCFTPAGCHDHANQRTTTADGAFGFSYGITPDCDDSADNALTLKPISTGQIIPDEDLTQEQSTS